MRVLLQMVFFSLSHIKGMLVPYVARITTNNRMGDNWRATEPLSVSGMLLMSRTGGALMRILRGCIKTRKLSKKFKYWNKKTASRPVNAESSAFKGECHLSKLFFGMAFFTILKMSREGMEVMTNGFEIYQ